MSDIAVGVIGLGVMGSAIARRLLTCLGSLAVNDVRHEAGLALAHDGAAAHADPASLAAVCDVAVLSLNTADVVRQVVFGPQGLAAAGRPLLVIDMSSIDPVATRAIATDATARGMAWVDAPLSGGAPAASSGRLALMVGGADDDVVRARAVLDLLASRVTHLGPVGAGQVVKLVNQVIVGTAFSAIAEAAALVRAEGLQAQRVLAALTGGRADSALLQEFFAKFVAGDLTPTGKVANMVKDLDTARDHARSAGVPLPITAQVCELNRWLVAQGHGDADNAALMGYYEAALLPQPALNTPIGGS